MKDSERMVISAYLDGEVEAPWKAEVEKRLAQDPGWAAEAGAQNQLRSVLAADPEPDFASAQARVSAQIQALVGEKPASSRPLFRGLPLAWVSVAAAAVLFVAVGAGFLIGRQSALGTSSAAEVSELQVQVPRQLELKLSGEGQLLMASTLEGSRR